MSLTADETPRPREEIIEPQIEQKKAFKPKPREREKVSKMQPSACGPGATAGGWLSSKSPQLLFLTAVGVLGLKLCLPAFVSETPVLPRHVTSSPTRSRARPAHP